MTARVNLGVVEELQNSPVQCINHQDRQFVLIHLQGKFYLLDNLCPHKAAALCEGVVKGFEIHCPWHKARFDIRTGHGLSPLAGNGVTSWPLSIEDGQLMAQLSSGPA